MNRVRTCRVVEHPAQFAGVLADVEVPLRPDSAAFDAGYAAALSKPLIVMHPPELQHALKELDAAACAVAETTAQVVEVLRYAFQREDWRR